MLRGITVDYNCIYEDKQTTCVNMQRKLKHPSDAEKLNTVLMNAFKFFPYRQILHYNRGKGQNFSNYGHLAGPIRNS